MLQNYFNRHGPVNRPHYGNFHEVFAVQHGLLAIVLCGSFRQAQKESSLGVQLGGPMIVAKISRFIRNEQLLFLKKDGGVFSDTY